VSCLQRRQTKRSTAIWKNGKLYINNHIYQLKTKPTLPNKINNTEAWDRCQSCQNYSQSLKICVQNINGLNPVDIVDLQSRIEKYDLAMCCDTWLKETIDYTIKWRNYMQVLYKPRLVQTKKLKELLEDF